MKKNKVNLKKLYPNKYVVDEYIQLDDKILEIIDKNEHIDSAYERKERYHKA